MSKKILVTFFSASGETKHTAQKLAQALSADLQEILPEVPYTGADLNWNNKQSRSSVEMSDLKFRPAMKKVELNLSAYDEVLVGFPVWWGIAPTIINTFLEQYDFSGRAVRAFATSGGSGIGNCEKSLQKQYPKIDWQPGKLLNNDAAIKDFVKMIG